MEGHVRAFNWLGGVPQRIVYDNVTTAMKKILSGHDRELNERFVVLRSHYLFDSVFCNVAAAWEKGTVENLVGYVRLNCLTPEREQTQQISQELAKDQPDTEASLNSCHTEGDGYACFSSALTTDADHILLLSDELAVGQGQDLNLGQ